MLEFSFLLVRKAKLALKKQKYDARMDKMKKQI